MNSLVIGIDIGGTSIKLGCFSRDGVCHRSKNVQTPRPATPKAVIDLIKEVISMMIKEPQIYNLGPIQGIGIGVPGPVDAEGRTSIIAINLTDWQHVPLAELLEEKTGLPVVIANDANCAGLTPEAVIIGGGISAAAKLFLPATKAEIKRRVLLTSSLKLQLLIAKLGNQAGVIGAAKLAWTKFSDQ